VFELAVAAALEKKLCILPVWLGPGVFFMVLWTFLLHLALFVTYAAEPDSAHMDSWSTVVNQIVMLLLILIPAAIGSIQVRSISAANTLLHKEIGNFSAASAECFCCSVNHVNPHDNNALLLCDRKMVNKCIKEWFVSMDAFDHYVHTNLKDKFKTQLSVPWRFVTFAGLPSLWNQCGTPIWEWRAGHHSLSKMVWRSFFSYGVVDCLFTIPFRLWCCWTLAEYLSKFPIRGWRGRSVTFMFFVCTVVIVYFPQLIKNILQDSLGPALGALVECSLFGTCAMLQYSKGARSILRSIFRSCRRSRFNQSLPGPAPGSPRIVPRKYRSWDGKLNVLTACT